MTDASRPSSKPCRFGWLAIKDSVAGRDADPAWRPMRSRVPVNLPRACSSGSVLGASPPIAIYAAEAAWRQLSVEASNVIDVLRRRSTPAKEVNFASAMAPATDPDRAGGGSRPT